jgi:glycosyltransferase involved in cell wall biosynthesis
MSSKKIAALYSRDVRTFRLFRKSWLVALEGSNYEIKIYNRGFGFKRLLKAITSFIFHQKSFRLIFGTSEICLYYIFSRKEDLLIFSGLGRLLQEDGFRKRLICKYLKFLYKNQTIVALNVDDALFLKTIFLTDVILINGEGFNFNASQIKRELKDTIVVAYVGRMLKSKGVDKLIEEFLLIKNDHCELHLFGDFDFSNSDSIHQDWLCQKIKSSKGKIFHHGFVDNMKTIWGGIDILVSLSEREGLPFSVLEAIDAGCFLLLSAVPGHFPFASLAGVDLINPNEVLGSLSTLIANPRKITNFNQKQRIQECEQRFGMSSVVNQITVNLLRNYDEYK